MKKLISVFLAAFVIFSLAACGREEAPSGGTEPEPAVQSTGVEREEENSESSLPDEAEGKETNESVASADEADTADETEESGVKALVVYFSATGNTKAVAETLAGLQDADIYEIVPEQPYTDEDLNYNDRTTRATAEQNDPDARPAIQGSITDFEQYEVVYVGYPIWWGDMPRILYTFFDTYDFGGKTIAPFCTSGGSGLSGTPGTIAELETGATVLDGLHISDSAADNAEGQVSDWLVDIGQAE